MRQDFLRKKIATIAGAALIFGFLASQIFAADLTVSISANPDLGVGQLLGVDLTATVSGTATGNITYKFDCTSDGLWDLTPAPTSQTTYSAVDLCNYFSPGNYTATVRVERDIFATQATLAIVVDPQPKPTVDLKVNNSNGPITIDYNTAASLTWTSTNATACSATGDWLATGAKATQNTTGESTGNLTSPKIYTIICSGPGGNSDPDSVTVNVNPQKTLYVAFEPYPNVGAAPLNGVDFRATVTGTTAGLITYRIDCTGNGNWSGSWEHEALNQSANPYFANDICDGSYPTAGTYAPKFQVARDGLTVNGNSTIIATSGSSNPTIFVGLSPQPSSGPAPLSVVLTATVTGTATGSVSFTFNCGNGGGSQTVTPAGTTASYNCSYASANVYTARVSATRGGLTSQGNTIIIVQ